jgi:succinyl-diaminopimelate desuccinylase
VAGRAALPSPSRSPAEETAMTDLKDELLRWIDRDSGVITDFLSRFIRAKSPNPPGDTREAVALICSTLEEQGLPYEVIAPQPEMPNIVGSFECGRSGRHLVLNGHIDVFPIGDEKWTFDPWSGDVSEGRICGRGSTDMKAGTAASIFTYAYLYRIRESLKGRLTLTAVSDEETLGPWGARYLMEHHPEIHGDCLLNGEPSGLGSIRYGEKGSLWLHLTVSTPGAHGGYTHRSASATKIACQLVADLEEVTSIKPPPADELEETLIQVERATDEAQGPGAYQAVRAVTLNVGVIRGGLKVNMVPGICVIEADIRLPMGVSEGQVMGVVKRIVGKHPEATVDSVEIHPPNSCDSAGEMVRIIQENVMTLRGFKPTPIVSLGGTDARLWRFLGIPAYVYGVSPSGMASMDEHVNVDDYLHVVKTHVISAYDYLVLGK